MISESDRANSHRRRTTGCTLYLRRLRRSLVCLLVAALTVVNSTVAVAQERLIEQRPHDRIVVRGAKGEEVVDVFPLDFPGRRIPANPRPEDTIQVTMTKYPVLRFDVPWQAIRRIELFEDRVLSEAEAFTEAGNFDEAYNDYAYLAKNYPDLPGLNESISRYLQREAEQSIRAKKYEEALMVLLEIARRNPSQADLPQLLDRVGERLVQQYFEDGKYSQARGVLQLVRKPFPRQPFERLEAWQDRFAKSAAERLAVARQHAAAGRFREAKLAAADARAIWPNLPDIAEFERQVRKEYPQVLVGVTSPAPGVLTSRIDDWNSRRVSRLVRRELFELVDYGSEGGVYRCPYGDMTQDATGKEMSIQLRPGITLSGGAATLTGHDVARRLLEMTEDTNPDYRADWANVFGSVSVVDGYEVKLDLSRMHVRPEGLLQTSIDGADQIAEGATSGGPYYLAERNDKDTVFRLNTEYFASLPTQPKEIVEVTFADPFTAVTALRRGDIDVLERVPLESLDTLQADENIVVEQYALPTVHVLIPNMRKPRMNFSEFRRAISYGINREVILAQLVAAGKPLVGFTTLSGPFPKGVGLNDPIGFAYDSQIEPRPYAPRLALILANVARKVAEQADTDQQAEADVNQKPAADAKADATNPAEGKNSTESSAGNGDAAPTTADKTVDKTADSNADNNPDAKAEESAGTRGAESATDKSATDKSATDKSATDKSAAEEGGADKSADDKTGAETDAAPAVPPEPIILAYPPTFTARAACQIFRQQLELVEIPCQLKELQPGDLADPNFDYDLLYAELAMWEPVVQARRLLGPEGLTGGCSPYMTRALLKLDESNNWGEVRNRLRNIHQVADNDMAVIPLWQTVNYFAYRSSLKNVGQRPVVLYQNVEDWQIDPDIQSN